VTGPDGGTPAPPRQAIAVAALMCVICGVLSILLGLAAFLPVTVALLADATRLRFEHVVYFGLVVGVALGPGVVYLCLPVYLERRRAVPVIAGAVVAILQAVGALAGAVIAVAAFIERGAGRFATAPLVGAVAIALVCGTHAYSLVRAARAFTAPDFDGPRGFEPTEMRPQKNTDGHG
jgi:hypothetical protein